MTDSDPSIAGKFFQDSSYYSVARLLPAVVGVVLLMVFTRVFSPVAYGRYVLTMTAVSIGATLSTGWLEQSIIRYSSTSNQATVRNTVVTSILLIAVLVLVVGAAGFLLLDLGVYNDFYAVGVALMIIQGTYSVLTSMYESELRSRTVVVYTAIQSSLKLALSLAIAVVLLDSILGWMWGGVLSIGITVALMARRLAQGVRLRFDKELLARMFHYGVPLIGSNLCFLLLTFADRILIEIFIGTSMVGVYTSNYTIVNRGMPLLFTPMMRAAQPLVMNRWDESNLEEIQGLITRFTRYFLLLGVLATVLTAGFSRYLSRIFLGQEYWAGSIIIPFVAAGLFAWALSNLGQIGLAAMEKTPLSLYVNVVAVVLNIGLNVALIPAYGIIGAAVATFLSFLAYLILGYAVTQRHLAWRLPRKTMVNCGVATAFTVAVIVLASSLNLSIVLFPVAALCAALSYVVVLYKLGEFREGELTRVAAVVRSRLR